VLQTGSTCSSALHAADAARGEQAFNGIAMHYANRIRSPSERKRLKFHYRVNKRIRYAAMKTMDMFVAKSKKEWLDCHKERIEKILLVRTTFRIGDSILTTPAISIFRENFPEARIDFVGGPISRILFQNLPIDHHYQITRRFPNASWAYLLLLRQIRSVGYDLAIELSYSQSTMGSFIVGFSGVRFRIGRQGKWDHWFDIKLPKMAKMAEVSKYKRLPVLLGSPGLETKEIFPSMILSSAEREEGQRKIAALIGQDTRPILGFFVGARVSWGKR
jgi:ADP-heptose:LPS heptosyltransferase